MSDDFIGAVVPLNNGNRHIGIYSKSIPAKAFSTTPDFSWSCAKPSTTAVLMDIRVDASHRLKQA